MSRTDKILLYIIILLVLYASYFVRDASGDKYIKIKGTTKYYYIEERKKDTLIVDERELSDNILSGIKMGLYD